MNYSVKIEFVTPSLAAKWLATSEGNPRWRHSKNNKVVDNTRVKMIANDIASGNWNPGNNTIAFDTNGCLKDGHHRLSAVIKAGIGVDMIVVYGVDEKGQGHIDDNRRRTDAQRSGYDQSVLSVPVIHMAMLVGVMSSNAAKAVSYEE